MSKNGIFYILESSPFFDIFMVKFICFYGDGKGDTPTNEKTF